MSREMWAQVNGFSDGDSLNADTLNVPIGQLGDRTEYLYARLKELMAGGARSSLVLADVPLASGIGREPEVGNAVSLDRATGKFAAAKASISLYDDFKAADCAFTVGVLISKTGTTGSVLIYGKADLGSSPDMVAANMLQSGESFRAGRYYLSATEPGKLTSNPSGPLIYVCSISGKVSSTAAGGFSKGSFALVNPQFLDIGTSHVHRTAVLTARPAGSLSEDGKSVVGYLPSNGGPLALQFGGTWTSKDQVNYEFSISAGSVSWQSGVQLKWKENGKGSYSVAVPAPGVWVDVSNGLKARLSYIPTSESDSSSPSDVFAGEQWDALTFPDAGAGWVDHAAFGTGSSDVTGFRVAVSGKVETISSVINVAFPKTTVLRVATPDETFGYGDHTYEFVTNPDSYSGTNIAVQRGSTALDSALYLVEALSDNETDATFAAASAASDNEATILCMYPNEVQSDDPSYEGNDFAIGESTSDAAHMVVYDGNGLALGANPITTNVSPYEWTSVGDLSVMLYKEGDSDVTVPAGTIVPVPLADYEPEALYDYCLGMDPQLSNHWPPVPPKSAALLVNGVEMDNKAFFPENPTVSFSADTIHWFEDDEEHRPWPQAFVSRDIPVSPSEDKAEVMHWVKCFQGATGPVTSLQAREGSPIKVVGYGTDSAANVGDLEIVADFDFKVADGGVPGYNVPKTARNGKLMAGPVVEKIVGGAGISVISKAGCPAGQGTVVVALQDDTYRSPFGDIALENAEQAKIGMFPYIRLKGYLTTITSPSAFTATMRVPTSLPDGKYALRIQAAVFGESGFTGTGQRWACVKMDYNILPDYSGPQKFNNLKTGLLKPDAERTVLIPFGHSTGTSAYSYESFDPVAVVSKGAASDNPDVVWEAFGNSLPFAQDFAQQPSVIPELRPGYLLGVRFSRAVTNDPDKEAYTGPIGFINLSWNLVSVD